MMVQVMKQENVWSIFVHIDSEANGQQIWKQEKKKIKPSSID